MDTMTRCRINTLMGAALTLTVLGGAWAATEAEYTRARERLVASLEQTRLTAEGIKDEQVLKAMRAVPRHEYVPASQKSRAYVDSPLPIGHGQTISQPYIVALMTQLLRVTEDDVVLEIGTGSGYQAAVLAEIVKEVYTIEIVEPLAKQSKALLAEHYENVEVRHGDGYHGWEEHAPYDAIIVTAAASHIPPPLLEQLKPGGRMVIPVGAALGAQSLLLVEKREDGTVTQKSILPVRFVPFTRAPDAKP
jgi:protein-L-isoaspartate(D-aspartate) O-methyltransferase